MKIVFIFLKNQELSLTNFTKMNYEYIFRRQITFDCTKITILSNEKNIFKLRY